MAKKIKIFIYFIFTPYLHSLTFVFVAAVCFVTLVLAVGMAIAHSHRQQAATPVTHELFSGAAL